MFLDLERTEFSEAVFAIFDYDQVRGCGPRVDGRGPRVEGRGFRGGGGLWGPNVAFSFLRPTLNSEL